MSLNPFVGRMIQGQRESEGERRVNEGGQRTYAVCQYLSEE